jgi:hypothetical protein
MALGGVGRNGRQRVSTEDRMRADRALSDRHYLWGDDCPAVDLDFLLCEYNHGIAVSIVDYKHHQAKLDNTNARTISTLSHLYGPDGRQLPFFIARYWDGVWAFKVKPVNDAAVETTVRIGQKSGPDDLPEWIDMSERQYVRFLMLMRKEVLTLGDRRTLDRLNTDGPPSETEAA